MSPFKCASRPAFQLALCSSKSMSCWNLKSIKYNREPSNSFLPNLFLLFNFWRWKRHMGLWVIWGEGPMLTSAAPRLLSSPFAQQIQAVPWQAPLLGFLHLSLPSIFIVHIISWLHYCKSLQCNRISNITHCDIYLFKAFKVQNLLKFKNSLVFPYCQHPKVLTLFTDFSLKVSDQSSTSFPVLFSFYSQYFIIISNSPDLPCVSLTPSRNRHLFTFDLLSLAIILYISCNFFCPIPHHLTPLALPKRM